MQKRGGAATDKHGSVEDMPFNGRPRVSQDSIEKVATTTSSLQKGHPIASAKAIAQAVASQQ